MTAVEGCGGRREAPFMTGSGRQKSVTRNRPKGGWPDETGDLPAPGEPGFDLSYPLNLVAVPCIRSVSHPC